MFRSFAAVAAAIGFLGFVAAGAPAQATAPTLDMTSFLNVGGFKFSWDAFDCSGPCSNTQVIANVGNNGIELVPISGAIVSGMGNDITAYIRIDSLTGAPINSYSVVTAGTSPGSAGVSLYSIVPFEGISGTATTAAAGFSSSVAIPTSPPRTSVIAAMDISANGGTITRVGISVTAVPEPATLAIFATGLVGLAGLRRRKTA
jgi:hypothetical protein